MQTSHGHQENSAKPLANLIIRPEHEGDAKAIHDVVEIAFQSKAVAEMVESIHKTACFVPELSLVAEVSGPQFINSRTCHRWLWRLNSKVAALDLH